MTKPVRGPRIAPSISCFSCQSRARAEWCALNDEDLELLDRSKVTLNHEPGQLVYAQGDACTGIHCIEEGNIAVRRVDADGNSMLVRLALAGQTVGYRDFFGGGGHTTSAEALSAVRVCHIEGEALRRLLDRNPALGLSFLSHLAEDLEQAEEALLSNATLPVRTRLAHLLLTLKDRFAGVADDGTIVLSLPLARQDMAALLGTRPETIARTIQALQSDSVATFSGRTVRIPDLDLLLNEIEPNA